MNPYSDDLLPCDDEIDLLPILDNWTLENQYAIIKDTIEKELEE